MAAPYIGEIRMFAGNFAPAGWALCEGQLLPISDNDTLFNLIGTTYGGDGQSTFGLPDLRGRVPVHMGNGFALAETGGVETVALTVAQIPAHSHALINSLDAGSQPVATGFMPAASNLVKVFTVLSASDSLSPQALTATGGSQAHANLQPYLCIDFIISLFGIYPSST